MGSQAKICSVDECERRTMARSLCTMHYQRWRKHGNALKVIAPTEQKRKPRPLPAERTCRVCSLTGSADLFKARANLCRSCDRAYKAQWVKDNPDKFQASLERGRDRQLRYEDRRKARRAGQDPDLIQRYRELHPGCCEICGRVPEGKRPSLYIDHDHETGGFRGLICGTCNSGLGHFKDNPESLRAAIAYLERGPVDLTKLEAA